jgi:hypothetical protein
MKKQLQALTGLTDESLFWLQVDYANTYLRDVMGCDEWSIRIICESRTFWAWWLNQWERRDEEIELNKENSYMANESIYKGIHHPASLNIFPHRIVMEESYAAMSTEMVKQATRNGH